MRSGIDGYERGGDRIAEVSKHRFRVRDTYGIEIAPEQDDALILATLAIDQMTRLTARVCAVPVSRITTEGGMDVPAEATETPVLDLLGRMTALSLDASTLDEHELMLVRIAALVAADAPPISYALNLGVAADIDIDVDEVRGVFAAIAPIVGTARIATAMGNIVKVLELKELAEAEELTTT